MSHVKGILAITAVVALGAYIAAMIGLTRASADQFQIRHLQTEITHLEDQANARR